MNAFHAYDIRGIYNTDFDKHDVYKIGFFLPKLLKAKKILVGRDVRVSSPEIFEYLTRGITDAGADVYNAGLATTPMIYWSTAQYDFDASVMITASHNPAKYNGLKVSKKSALPVGYDNGLQKIEKQIIDKAEIKPTKIKGVIRDFEVKPSYIEFQKKHLKYPENLKVIVDCSNGMAGLLIKDILGDLPLYINFDPDGSFPNHDPNPLDQKNVKQLKQAVLDNSGDIGIIFDGDADRVMFVDNKGRFVPPDLIIGLLGHHFLIPSKKDQQVLIDIRTSKSTSEYINKLGGNIHIWRVGRAYAALKLREIDGVFGGELAGHYYFKDFFYSDSGILAASLVLGIVAEFAKKEKSFSDLIDKIKVYENSGEINFRVKRKKEAMDKVKDHFLKSEKVQAFLNFDGYRIEFKNWWFNIRPSNTEPYLRLLVEADTAGLLDKKIQEIESIINEFK